MTGDDLSEDAVRPELSTRWLGRSYHYVPETHSTNDLLRTRVKDGSLADPAPGTVLLAEYQISGRGRLGRRWEAPPGSSLLFSVLFRPGWPVDQASWMTMIAGLAMAESVEAMSGITVGLKWPNDLMAMVEGQWRKFGGLLLEATILNNRLVWAIIGVGINVNVAADQLPDGATPATSLMLVIGQPIPRRPLLLDYLFRLEQCYEAAEQGWSPWPAWNKRLITLGQSVTVSNIQGSPVIAGIAESTDESGRLLVRDVSGKLVAVSAGDVTLQTPGYVTKDNDG